MGKCCQDSFELHQRLTFASMVQPDFEMIHVLSSPPVQRVVASIPLLAQTVRGGRVAFRLIINPVSLLGEGVTASWSRGLALTDGGASVRERSSKLGTRRASSGSE